MSYRLRNGVISLNASLVQCASRCAREVKGMSCSIYDMDASDLCSSLRHTYDCVHVVTFSPEVGATYKTVRHLVRRPVKDNLLNRMLVWVVVLH